MSNIRALLEMGGKGLFYTDTGEASSELHEEIKS